ncbi:cysteine hydrolase family protein [Oceanidesulfovibrio marinus]|nr:isochorismatase family protein [Oceanidesulfovibrio marinus]
MPLMLRRTHPLLCRRSLLAAFFLGLALLASPAAVLAQTADQDADQTADQANQTVVQTEAQPSLQPDTRSGSIDEYWDMVETPPAPEIEDVTVEPDTALLILDIEERTCNAERRPRCLDTVPRIAKLMDKARETGITVVYSVTTKGSIRTILDPVKPHPGEIVVGSSVDKFWNTNLESYLNRRRIKNVIITGTAAHGAVLHTATAAGFRGMHIILPVDCISAEDLYAEQATVELLLTGPATRGKVTITRSDRMTFPAE